MSEAPQRPVESAPVARALTLAEALTDAKQRLQGIRLLVAEDDAVNRMVMQRFLQRAGLEAVFAENGAAAVTLAAAHAFDAVVMDMHMPVMDGLEATRRIRAMGGVWQTLPVIALSGGVTETERHECFAAGMDAFLSKPVDFAEFLSILQRLTGRM